jgi:drug/metabolite transporter (DMT)-like permease
MEADIRPADAAAAAPVRRSTVLGMACMAGSAFLFMTGNALIKLLAESGIPPIETVLFRSSISLVLLTPFALGAVTALRTARLGLHLVRGLVQAASMICFFTAIAKIALVEANALEFTSPIFATLFAMLFLGEAVRTRRLVAMGIGFVGAVVALRPGFAEITDGHWLILFACILWAGVLVMIRSLSATESALTQSLYIGLVLTPLAIVMTIPAWVSPDWAQLAMLCTVGGTATLGQYLFAQAFRFAEMSAVLPLDFSKLIWSSAYGFLIFHHIPDVFVVLGGAIIFAAGAYITIREAQLQRAKAA